MLKTSKINIRVRYGETDKMGIVYYGNYPLYLEQGRTEWLRELGFSYRWMEENHVHLPVVNLNIDYKNPAYYDDVLTVVTTLKNIPTRKIEFEYKILSEVGKILIEATTTLVFINSQSGKIMNAPDYLLKKLEEVT